MADDLKDEKPIILSKSAREKLLKEYFELNLTETALTAYKQKDYMRAAMLSWSYIEEYFLPYFIDFVAKRQKINLDASILDNVPVAHLIRYYYFISYDELLFLELEKARKLRNKMVHRIYQTRSIKTADTRAKESAKFNIDLIVGAIFDREEGKVVPPALRIATDARNSLRHEIRERLGLLGLPEPKG